MLNLAAYCRVSTDDDDQMNSLTSQKIYFTNYINEKNDWKLVKVYADEGITGTNTKKRVEFNKMMREALAGNIDLIITKEVSRFARNTVDTLEFTRKLKAKGVGVIFINDNIDTRDRDGEFRLTIMASVAQEESRKTSERVKWGMKRKMEQGYVFVNTVLGYDAEKGNLTINEKEADIVRMIFNKFVYEGKGAYTIALELINDKVPTPASKRIKKWSPIAVTRILKNEKYVGDLLQKKTYTPDFLEHKSVRNDDQEEKVFIKDHHEAIIDRNVWDLAQKEFSKRKSMVSSKTRYSSTYWCSGKVFCGICGSCCVVRAKRLSSGQKYIAWRCKEATMYGEPRLDGNGNKVGCTNGQVNIKALNACMQFALKQLNLQRNEILASLQEDILSLQEDKVEDNNLELTLAKLNYKKEQAIDLMLEGTISKEELQSMKKKYDCEIEDIKGKLQQMKNNQKAYKSVKANIKMILDKIKSILEQTSETEELYRQMTDKIVIYPSNDIDIYLKYIPYPIAIRYSIEGRGKTYQTLCSIRNQ